MKSDRSVIYVAAKFPKLSETFVYREVLSLRQTGLNVPVVSVRPPEDEVEDPQVVALREGVIPVYGGGVGTLLKEAFLEKCTHPLRSFCLCCYALKLCFTCKDLQGAGSKMKVLVQAFASLALAHRLRPYQPALLHAHMAHVPTTFAMFTARQLGIPFSFTGHAADLFRDRSLLIPKLRNSEFVHCISEWHQSFYQELVPRPPEDYPMVRCGVDPAEFSSIHTPSDHVRLLAVGRLVQKKGFDLLLDALAHPQISELDWELELIGSGPEADALQAQFEKHPAKDKIHLAGAQPNGKVREAMKKADAFLLPCRVDAQGDRDGIPVVLMEAMAAGTVVVSGDIPSIRELIENGKSGYMIPPGDQEALQSVLKTICTSPERRASMQDAALTRIIEEFTLEGNTQRILDNMKKHNLWKPGP